MGRVNHQLIRLSPSGRQGGEDPAEHTHPAPPNKAVVDVLVRAILTRRITPAKTVADDEDNRADNPTVIHTGHAMR